MNVGVLVGTLVLDEVVDVHADFTGLRFRIVHADHNTGGIHVVDQTAARGGNHGTRVNRRHPLNASTDKGFFRTQHGHGLTLHVRTHQRAVRIIMLQERHQGGGNGHDLRWRHVHVLNALGTNQNGLAFFAGRHQVTRQLIVFVQCRIGLGNHILAFFDGGQIVDLIGNLAVCDATVRCFDKAVFVQAGIKGQ